MCVDVDECESDSAPCNKTTEFCSNLPGSFVCKCAGDLVRGDNEECVTEAERKKQRDSLKEKKKKRKKKRKVKKGNSKEDDGDIDRKYYPWYYMLAPIIFSWLVYNYWKPNLVTSVGMILFVGVSATLAPQGAPL